jgi:hypothetical protein
VLDLPGICILETSSALKEPTGRPKTRWKDDVKKDILKLKVPNWRTLVQNRRRWKGLVEKAKTLD